MDENDCVIGAEYRPDAVKKGLTRRVSRMYVFNTSGQLLVQQRSEKVSNPSHFDQSAAGHVDEGESYYEAAIRELQEELGLSGLTLEEIVQSFPTKNVFNAIYKVVVAEGSEINFDPKEVQKVMWYNIADLDEEMKQIPEKFTPGFHLTWSAFKDKMI